ncbi:MAG: Spy/CpxP family protein refolding chaperone [Phycisphaerae bacterium]
MIRVRTVSISAMALVLAAAFVVAQGQDQPAQRTRRGPGGGISRGSLLGLLRLEQVQKELKLSDEQLAKVKKVSEEISAEMKKQYAALREIEDRQKRREKMTELADQYDQKAREQLRDVLAREQMTRLYQVRLQVRDALDSLGSGYVAGKLKLTDEQKKKLVQISKDVQAKRTELFRDLRDASQEQRTEAYQKYRKLRSDADKEALEALTAEQKKAFEEMKGKKIELPTGRGPR